MTQGVLPSCNPLPRHPKRGVVLITTLLSLILLMGLVVTLQTRSLATVKMLKRLAASHQEVLDQDSLRDLIRPLVGEAMIRFDEDTPLKLNSTPFPVTFNETRYQIIAQDPGGLVDIWRTPPSTAEALLSPKQLKTRARLAEAGDQSMPIRQAAAKAGVAEVPPWLTDRAPKRKLNAATLAASYAAENARNLRPRPDNRQPKEAMILIEEITSE
ncbi:hypothetical protein [Leisingera sp. ANG-M7]|uniref:hypothetical protein n=1 Tax=Leisingera sp. ANG-M7 TaxID=1577902 RepID=UPI000580133A|nr:hypothetical protein [Leisingera sp. ANG-M7]KIC34978.1 hypothetical protein RA26_20050 [Leisingera sp. ANG-M7]